MKGGASLNTGTNLYTILRDTGGKTSGTSGQAVRKKYGIVENVSDREYVSNGFHCHVTEDITPPIQSKTHEYRFSRALNGGKIQYVKYPIDFNEAIPLPRAPRDEDGIL